MIICEKCGDTGYDYTTHYNPANKCIKIKICSCKSGDFIQNVYIKLFEALNEVNKC
jgi:hypothetical protein